MAEFNLVGKSLSRVDAMDKVTGKALYSSDLKMPNMLIGGVLRSKCPHGRITRLDTQRAERLPGVKAVITGKDMVAPLGGVVEDQYPIAVDTVRYVGEAIAAVAAIDVDLAEEALALIEVEYQELAAIFDPEEAMEPGASLIHERINEYFHEPGHDPVKNSNICCHFKLKKGDVEEGFRKSFLIAEDRFTTQKVQHCSLESHVVLVHTDFSGRTTLWSSHQSPYLLRSQLARSFKIPSNKIRVVIPYVGGGFGGKTTLKAMEAIPLALSLKTVGRPVFFSLSREEEFVASTVRHPTIICLKTGVSNKGLILARELRIIWDTGAYADSGPRICKNAGFSAAGPYQVENVKIDSYCVYTNQVISGPFRGFGIPQVTWALESQMDILAEKLGMDPLEFRLKNCAREGSLSATGQKLQNVGVGDCLIRAADGIGWRQRLGVGRGKGIACMHKNTAAPTSSSAFIKINEDGTATVLVSAVDVGQGSSTILLQIASEILGLSPEMVTIATPDTEATPYDSGTFSSRITFFTGNAVKAAALDARQQLFDVAGEVLEASVTDLEIAGGQIYVKGSPDKTIGIAQLSRTAHFFQGGPILGRGSYLPKNITPLDPETGQGVNPTPFWMYAAQAVDVEVDERTGQVKVLRVYAVHDAGRVINPLSCSGQLEGALVTGLGATLVEELVVDRGSAVNASFADYKCFCAPDVPILNSDLVEIPHKEGPFGAKGMAEPGLAPTAAAIANAVYDAVGIRIKDLPLTPEKVLRALKEKRKAVQ